MSKSVAVWVSLASFHTCSNLSALSTSLLGNKDCHGASRSSPSSSSTTPNPNFHPAAALAKALLSLKVERQEGEDSRMYRSLNPLPLLFPNNHTMIREVMTSSASPKPWHLWHMVLCLLPQQNATSFKSKVPAPGCVSNHSSKRGCDIILHKIHYSSSLMVLRHKEAWPDTTQIFALSCLLCTSRFRWVRWEAGERAPVSTTEKGSIFLIPSIHCQQQSKESEWHSIFVLGKATPWEIRSLASANEFAL